VGENSRTILGDMFVEQDARLSTAHSLASVLALEKRAIAQILTIILDESKA